MILMSAVMSSDRNKRFSASAGGNPMSAKTFPSAGVTCVVPSYTRSRTARGRALELGRGRVAGFLARPARLDALTVILAPSSGLGTGVVRDQYRAETSFAISFRTHG